MPKFIVRTDGGSRSNPGPAALGAVICNEKGDKLKEYGEYLGVKTNNEAEYQAVIFALKKIKSTWGKEEAKKSEVKVLADSELLVKQMTGRYKIENEKLQPLFLELWNLLMDFKKVEFQAVPREQNKEADRLVNEALDAKSSSKQLL
ncbi:MAG: ribonuclease HI family protein [Candidatus Wildermuthbacteria bacterium]|nr:ribonuclease HI family protein [Candidatus Wildermuthbacteria bacterium]